MTKAILFDADGVTLIKQGYFSEKLSKEYNIPLEKITPFFKNDFRLCQQGKLDLKVILPEYLIAWNWKKSLEYFISYWFESDTKADIEVIQKIQNIRNNGIKCYLVSDQEQYRAEYILDNLNFKNYFDNCFFSYKIKTSKSDKEFFIKILQELRLEASELSYLDDEEKNVAVAKKLGINAHYFTNINDINLCGKK